jgi:hypothetical protein
MCSSLVPPPTPCPDVAGAGVALLFVRWGHLPDAEALVKAVFDRVDDMIDFNSLLKSLPSHAAPHALADVHVAAFAAAAILRGDEVDLKKCCGLALELLTMCADFLKSHAALVSIFYPFFSP